MWLGLNILGARFDGNCDRHTGGENRIFWNVDKLDSDRDSLRKTDPLKGRVYVLQQVRSGRILRIPDPARNAIDSSPDRVAHRLSV
jgi:hypothetical protein